MGIALIYFHSWQATRENIIARYPLVKIHRGFNIRGRYILKIKNKLSETVQNEALLSFVQFQTTSFFIFNIHRPRMLNSIYHITLQTSFFRKFPRISKAFSLRNRAKISGTSNVCVMTTLTSPSTTLAPIL